MIDSGSRGEDESVPSAARSKWLDQLEALTQRQTISVQTLAKIFQPMAEQQTIDDAAITQLANIAQKATGTNKYSWRSLVISAADIATKKPQLSNTVEELYERMKACGVACDSQLASKVLRVTRDPERCLAVLEHAKAGNGKPTPTSYRLAIETLAGCGKVDQAYALLHEMRDEKARPSTYAVYAVLFNACVRHNIVLASKVYREMVADGWRPSTDMISRYVRTIRDARLDAEQAFDMVRELFAKDLAPSFDWAISTSLMNILARFGKLESVPKLIGQLDALDWTTTRRLYNAALAVSRTKAPEALATIFHAAQDRGVVCEEPTYAALIAQCGDLNQARRYLNAMKRSGLQPNHQIYHSLLKLCKANGDVNRCMELLREMERSQVPPKLIDYTMAMELLAKSERIAHASRLQFVDEVLLALGRHNLQPDAHLCTAILDLHCNLENEAGALQLLMLMSKFNLPLDSGVFVPLLKTAAENKDDSKALQYFSLMQQSGVTPEVVTYTATIHACIEAQNFVKALELVDEMVSRGIRPSVITYNAMIRARGELEGSEAALGVLREMEQQGIAPNLSSFGTLLKYCEGDCDRSLGVLDLARQHSLMPDEAIYRQVLSNCRSDTSQALRVLHETHRHTPSQIQQVLKPMFYLFSDSGNIAAAVTAWRFVQEHYPHLRWMTPRLAAHLEALCDQKQPTQEDEVSAMLHGIRASQMAEGCGNNESIA